MAPHIVRVSTQELQERFEEEGLRKPEHFGIEVVDASVGKPGDDAPEDLDIGSTSVLLSYRERETGREVATAHVYRYADGTPRFTPDPKTLTVGDTDYVLDRRL
jgi:hypothetical protein